jgi:hypothetical protein
MAFKSRDLSVLAYANGFTLWHYTTYDLATEVDTTGYFNTACDMLRVGDMIMSNLDTDGSPQSGIMVVLSNAGGTVDVANLTQVGASNSD